ncbi:MAG: hypothetical protein ABJN26_08455 [Stappiaceae bacterium]
MDGTQEIAKTVYVSVTGLRPKNIFQYLRFWYFALPVMRQARQSPGNISAEARKINGVFHTVSVWEDDFAMRRFLYQGAHRKAISAFPSMATGKTFGFYSQTVPSWAEVPVIWHAKGREYDKQAAPLSVTETA